MRYVELLLLLLVGLAIIGCTPSQGPSHTSDSERRIEMAAPNNQGIIPPERYADEARAFSDGFAIDLLAGRRTEAWAKMLATYREQFNQQQFEVVLDQMYQEPGMPLKADFKTQMAGTKDLGSAGGIKPMQKIWYAVQTTKHAKGTHFLFVEVVPDGTAMGVVTFAIVTFPAGPPPNLK
jgi:hypothetical protein